MRPFVQVHSAKFIRPSSKSNNGIWVLGSQVKCLICSMQSVLPKFIAYFVILSLNFKKLFYDELNKNTE